jgi:carboxyl-terminal processing protease
MTTRNYLLAVLIAAALISSTFISHLSQAQNATPPKMKLSDESAPPVPAIPDAPPKTAADKPILGKDQKASEDDINRFTNTIVLIKDFYVQPVGDKNLLDDAIRGMVSGLDPHSEYLDKDAYKTLLMTTSGEFGGVGIEVTPEFGILRIVAPMDDTPASKAGIKAGDYIVAIDSKLVSEMTLQDAVDKMRGKAGTPVMLTILRKGEKVPLNFKLKREIIHIASVKSRMLDNNFGYVRLTQFQEPTAKLMRDAILQLKAKNNGKLSGLVIDLRNNPGGLLETAVQVVDSFLDKNVIKNKYNDVIVYTEGRLPEAQYKAKAKGSDMLNGAPIVILINNGSASASEIVAGAMQDYRRALIVGTTSFGKGSVQTVIPLDKTHALKLTTALYHTPSGRVIQNVGIVPDVQIEDLVITPNKNDQDLAMIEPIKEFQLKNHLAGSNGKPNPDAVQATANDSNLARSDFQLYEALKILRTMSMISDKPMMNMPAVVPTPTKTATAE